MKKIKKIFVIFVAVCALFCTVGCSIQDYFDKIDSTLDGYLESPLNSEKDETSSERKENSSEETENSSSSDVSDSEDVEDEEETLVIPDNVLDYVALGLEVNETATPNFEYCTTDSGAIRFFCSVSAELKAEVDEDESKSLGMVVYPLSYFDSVNTENYKYMDWITAFDEIDDASSILTRSFDLYEQLDGSYVMARSLRELTYSSVNQAIVVMGVLITTDSDGNETYKYSTYASGNYRTNARSLGYVAAESLSRYALGQESYTADEIELCKTYVNWSVDKANGSTEPTDDDSTYTATVSPTAITLNVGETATLSVSVAEISHFSVLYKSLNEAVATISENGKIKAVATGNTIVAAYVAGVPYTVRITVL